MGRPTATADKMKHTTPRHVTPTAYRAGFPAIVSSQSNSSGVFLRASVSWVAKILHIRGSLTTAHGKCLGIVSGTLSAQGEVSAADDDYWKFLDKTALALSLCLFTGNLQERLRREQYSDWGTAIRHRRCRHFQGL